MIRKEEHTESISMEMARRLMLAAQGLEPAPPAPAQKAGILAAIRRMGYLQIDTIHVVNRSPYLVLYSRLGSYEPVWLDELQAEGALFEYWAHAMCFLPVEDYPLYRRRMLDAIEARGWPVKWAEQWSKENPEIVDRIRAHLRENGPVRTNEFKGKDRPPGGWWNWTDEKNALEALFYLGEVMIARRHKFQRVYDLRERVLPDWNDANAPSSEALQRALILRAVMSLGAAYPVWVSDYYRMILYKKSTVEKMEALAADGLLKPVEIEGLKGTAYIHPNNLDQLNEIAAASVEPAHTSLLSPFDPLVSDRERARRLFNFDYTIECYTPAHKRRFGYFSMPILHRGRLVGRLDPKAHRAQKLFEVKSLYLEPGVTPDEELVSGLAGALRRLAEWHSTPQVVIRQSDPSGLAERLAKAL